MKILAQIDTSREGNDCWIYEEYILCRIFDEEYVIHNYYAKGSWFGSKLETYSYPVSSLEEDNEEKDMEVYQNYLKLKQIQKF